VIGLGGIGLSAVNGAAIAGAGRIIAIDRVASKSNLAKEFGATDFVDASTVDLVKVIREMTGGGVDYSFECVGLKPTVEQSFRMIKRGARLAATFDRYAVTSDRIIRELAKIAFGNIGDFITVQDDGSLVVDFGTATREHMASLKSVEIGERTIDGAAAGVRRVKINLSDKRQALMDLAKIARMLPADRHEHSGPGGGPIAFEVGVREEHKIDIEAMAPDERDQLRQALLTAPAAKGV
jgi:zinc-binding dehydrogenase/terminase small subunit-like protein